MTSLAQRYQTLKQQSPQLRAVEAANQLGVSEAELLAIQPAEQVTALEMSKVGELLKKCKKLGTVMALTRNHLVVNEITGLYEKIYTSEHGERKMAIAINPTGIDLRLFIHAWRFGFAVNNNGRYSFQFFDQQGVAVHKIHLTQESNTPVFAELCEQFKAAEQPSTLPVQAVEKSQFPKRDLNEQQLNALRQDWQDLQDVHHFPALLKQHQLSRLQAMEVVGNPWSYEVKADILPYVLQQVAKTAQEIMIFVGNHGAVQIYTGKVDNLKPVGEWYNVLDKSFNLHAKSEQFARAFVVTKPTDEGKTKVVSIEFLDHQGDTVLTLFGRRTEGDKQLTQWVTLCEQLCSRHTI